MKLSDIFREQEKRIIEEPRFETSSFLRAFSIVSPEIAYYVISSCVIYFSAIAMNNGMVFPHMDEHSKGIATLISAIAVIVAVLPLIPAFKREYPRLVPKSDRKMYRIGLVVILAISSAVFFNVAFSLLTITQSSEVYEEVQNHQFSLPLSLGIIIYGVINPITEEIVHRGLIYNRLRRYFNLPIAMIFGPLLFGLSHGNMVQLLYGFIMGVFISFVYERYGAFLYPVIFHCVANIIVYTISCISTLSDAVYNVAGLVFSGFVMILILCIIVKEKVIDTNN